MDAIGLLLNPHSSLPRPRAHKELIDEVTHLFTNYKSTISLLSASDYVTAQAMSNSSVTSDVCQHLLLALQRYYQGFPHEAYSAVEAAIDLLAPYITNICSGPMIQDQLNWLYRAREGSLINYTKEQLFHIPFESRSKVTTKRYSIPGLPGLYFGGSIYICWEELGRPMLETLHVSKFRVKSGVTLRVLDFGVRPPLLAPLMNHPRYVVTSSNPFSDFVASYIISWPLLAACSIPVARPKDAFKPEYIIPQLLLQVLRHRDLIDGIRYFSTHFTSYNANITGLANYAFLARDVAPRGQCSFLRSSFEMTEPASWALLRTLNVWPITPRYTRFDLELVKGALVPYLDTEFGAMQCKVESLPIGPLV